VDWVKGALVEELKVYLLLLVAEEWKAVTLDS